MTHIPKWKINRLVLVFFDALMVALSLGFAYELRFEFHVLPEYHKQFISLVPFIVLLRLLLFWVFNLYKGILRYASISELIGIGFSISLGTAIISLFNIMTRYIPALWGFPLHSEGTHLLRIPWSIVIIEMMLTFLLISGGRFSWRIILTAGQRAWKRAKNVLIIGTDDLGESVAREMLKSPERGLRPVAFIDESAANIGRRIHNIEVAGQLRDIHRIIEQFNVDEVVIALPEPTPKKLQQIIEVCKKTPVQFRIVPSMHDVVEGRVSISQLRPVDVEDLLGREPVRLELPPEKNYIKGRCVLITGAGGSIGSEICRQTLSYNPAKLILFGKGENSIYEIATELGYQFKENTIEAIIGDIRDRDKLEQVFSTLRPDIIFHAAAHKHVPFMELHPDEAVKNNILGTYEVARCADKYHSELFVFISTDKAVRPTSIMGATKRLAEMLIFSLGQRSATSFIAVRFGNVLGSRGSVIPLFKRQIELGGPVTVTHPEVERYFMTVSEAVSLVIHSGALKDTASLFVLDMGNPVKIVDLARQLITLCGYTPEEDIEIKFIGLRPGEKLSEELLTEQEGLRKTEVGKIFAAEPEVLPWETMENCLTKLRLAAEEGNVNLIKHLLKEYVPDYKPG
ncbi:polysaccharide biosynthesis protein [Candidatus Sumerlaeota bacterium]|nr:polysaccharide biosynthesis protein [Candidatus Sumerlaeota bacterium]